MSKLVFECYATNRRWEVFPGDPCVFETPASARISLRFDGRLRARSNSANRITLCASITYGDLTWRKP